MSHYLHTILPRYIGGPLHGQTVPSLPDDTIARRHLRMPHIVRGSNEQHDDGDGPRYGYAQYTLESIAGAAPGDPLIQAWIHSEHHPHAWQAAYQQLRDELQTLAQIRTMLRKGRYDATAIAKLATPEDFTPSELQEDQ